MGESWYQVVFIDDKEKDPTDVTLDEVDADYAIWAWCYEWAYKPGTIVTVGGYQNHARPAIIISDRDTESHLPQGRILDVLRHSPNSILYHSWQDNGRPNTHGA